MSTLEYLGRPLEGRGGWKLSTLKRDKMVKNLVNQAGLDIKRVTKRKIIDLLLFAGEVRDASSPGVSPALQRVRSRSSRRSPGTPISSEERIALERPERISYPQAMSEDISPGRMPEMSMDASPEESISNYDLQRQRQYSAELKRKRQQIEDVSKADHLWLSYMNNQNYYREIMDYVIVKSGNRRVRYVGNVILASPPGDRDFVEPRKIYKALRDQQTHSIVIPALQDEAKYPPNKYPRQYVRKSALQKIYPSMAAYITDNPPHPQMDNIYFVGDLYGGKSFPIIHWNCFIIKRVNRDDTVSVLWFDPSMAAQTDDYDCKITTDTSELNMLGYSFNRDKFWSVLSGIERGFGIEPLEEFIAPNEVPQQYCRSGTDFVDLFCQSWVMLFAAAFANNKLLEFCRLPFNKYGVEILKAWLLCVLNNIPKRPKDQNAWSNVIAQGGSLYNFKYCRLPADPLFPYETGQCTIKNIQDLSKLRANRTCFDNVTRFYLSTFNVQKRQRENRLRSEHRERIDRERRQREADAEFARYQRRMEQERELRERELEEERRQREAEEEEKQREVEDFIRRMDAERERLRTEREPVQRPRTPERQQSGGILDTIYSWFSPH